MFFEPLSDDRGSTSAAMHAYAQAAIAPGRVHGIAHPKWWHVSLKVRPSGLVADPVPLPQGGVLETRLDIHRHALVMETNFGGVAELSMRDGASGTEMGDQVVAAAAGLGLEGDYDRSKFESDEGHSYDPDQAQALMAAIVNAHTVFERHRVAIGGPVSPIQFWPHGFDLSFEWYGAKTQAYEGDELPGQLSLGFYPRDRAYFYSNPWPFDESLLSAALPHGAEWHTEGWQGAILYHDQLAGDVAAAVKLEEFARAVYGAAAPTLTA